MEIARLQDVLQGAKITQALPKLSTRQGRHHGTTIQVVQAVFVQVLDTSEFALRVISRPRLSTFCLDLLRIRQNSYFFDGKTLGFSL